MHIYIYLSAYIDGCVHVSITITVLVKEVLQHPEYFEATAVPTLHILIERRGSAKPT